MKKILLSASLAGAIFFSACTSSEKLTKSKRYNYFYSEKPAAVLLMPPINKTTNVEAKDYFHPTLNVPLVNAGYYVVSPFLSMEILKRESAYDAEMFLDTPLAKFGEVFGADLALFTIIHKWEKTSILGVINVKVEYIFKSLKTNEIVYQRIGDITVNANSQNNQNGGLAGALINVAVAAISTATTNQAVVGSICNYVTLQDLPAGKYSPICGKDGDERAGAKEFSTTVNGNAKSIRQQSANWYSIFTKDKP